MRNFRWKIMGRLANNLFQFAYLYARTRDGIIPDWYVQDLKYFEPYQDEIKAMLQEGIYYIDRVAIHVRRGDYVGNPFYVDLSTTDYYRRAMAEFPNETFRVFSDDIPWCKEQEIFRGCEFSIGTDEGDINDIASCKAQIISNSSFGWWGAFLSPHGGKVIAPLAWHPDGVERTKLPSHWKRI